MAELATKDEVVSLSRAGAERRSATPACIGLVPALSCEQEVYLGSKGDNHLATDQDEGEDVSVLRRSWGVAASCQQRMRDWGERVGRAWATPLTFSRWAKTKA